MNDMDPAFHDFSEIEKVNILYFSLVFLPFFVELLFSLDPVFYGTPIRAELLFSITALN